MLTQENLSGIVMSITKEIICSGISNNDPPSCLGNYFKKQIPVP